MHSSDESSAPAAFRQQQATRVSTQSHTAVAEECGVVVEQPLTITIDGVGAYTVMCTPTDLTALAIGFAFSEGIITSTRDIDLLYQCEDDDSAIRMRLGKAPGARSERNLIVSSACGMCGSMAIEALLEALPAVPQTLTLEAAVILRAQAAMRRHQQIFAQTGGPHAAAIFTAGGEILACAEDIGRHNALDKCLGKCLLTQQPMSGCGAVLSGRASLEMIVKAARAGLEVVAAVSAPSTLAIDAAAHCGITLCGFVREDRLTAFSHPSRILLQKS